MESREWRIAVSSIECNRQTVRRVAESALPATLNLQRWKCQSERQVLTNLEKQEVSRVLRKRAPASKASVRRNSTIWQFKKATIAAQQNSYNVYSGNPAECNRKNLKRQNHYQNKVFGYTMSCWRLFGIGHVCFTLFWVGRMFRLFAFGGIHVAVFVG